MGGTDENGTRKIKSVITANEILRLLVERGDLSVTELATALDVTKGTVSVYLSTLRETGLVVETERGHRPSLRFLDIGNLVREEFPLYKHGKSVADQLALEVGHVVHLAVVEQNLAVVIYMTEFGNPAIQSITPIGTTAHLHSTAIGKAMLAQLPESRVDAIIEEQGLTKHTEQTITDKPTLMAELEQIRERGYAVNDQENAVGSCSVGAFVRQPNSSMLGAISTSGYATTFTDEYIDEIAPIVMEKANEIEVNQS
ncbi:IclR family transcriptional regulator [Haloarchaeobius sp. TZWWS8]|uniref:IclR family transcriptional regulator n=1 Tax=Haloarchaeobius sp. TZWWS8 TaxID=3446121 RepID=UPI003EBB7E0A